MSQFKIVVIVIVCLTCKINAQNVDTNSVYIDTIKIKMDTKMYLEYFQSDESSKFKIVESIRDSSKTVRLKLSFDKVTGSVLIVNNPFNMVLTYKAFLYNYKKKQYIETSVVPVRQELSTYEMWPYGLEHILLTDFKLTDKK